MAPVRVRGHRRQNSYVLPHLRQPPHTENLIVGKPGEYRWGTYRGYNEPSNCCLVARALDNAVDNPSGEAPGTRLKRGLTTKERRAIGNLDSAAGSRNDRAIVRRLARKMGVPMRYR